jgi:hypothetical protein
VNERRPVPRCGLALRGGLRPGRETCFDCNWARDFGKTNPRRVLTCQRPGAGSAGNGRATINPAGVPGRSASEPEFCTTADSLLSHQSVPSRRGRAGAPSARRPPA